MTVAVEFKCYVCGNESDVICAPDPPENCICPNCCEQRTEGHEFKRFHSGIGNYYDWMCDRCGMEPSLRACEIRQGLGWRANEKPGSCLHQFPVQNL